MRSGRRLDRVLAAALALLTVTWMLAVEGDEGIGRDEAQYMRAGERYWGWFAELGDNVGKGRVRDSFSQAGIDCYWADNPEHPAVMKTLFGVSWRLLHRCTCMGPSRSLHPLAVTGPHRTLPLFARESSAFRFPAIFFAGLLAAGVYLLTRQLAGRVASAAATLLAVAQPHYFFHAQIACFDAPITTMAVLLGLAYWKSLRSARWGLACGPLFGLALGVKHNAWLMPIFLLAHYLWIRRGDLRRRRVPRPPLAFVSMAVLGPLVFFMHWPWLWHAPVARVRGYVQRHTHHEHYNFEYLGRNWNDPPKELPDRLLRATFPFVSTGLTVPLTTLVLAAAGGVYLARRRRTQADAASAPHAMQDAPDPMAPTTTTVSWLRPGADVDLAPGAFLAAQVFGPISVLAVPWTPIFGGVKHFLPAMPYIAVAAGVGLERLGAALARWTATRPRLARVAPAALAALAVTPAVLETRRSHPDGLTHYNLVAGGFSGGASLGMNRQFWGYSVRPMLDWLSAHVPPDQRFYWHDVLGDALNMYIRDGRLKGRTGNPGAREEFIEKSAAGLLIHERHMMVYEGVFWDTYRTTRPTHVRVREGVPVVTVYQGPKR